VRRCDDHFRHSFTILTLFCLVCSNILSSSDHDHVIPTVLLVEAGGVVRYTCFAGFEACHPF
jgi:hypothetical protein